MSGRARGQRRGAGPWDGGAGGGEWGGVRGGGCVCVWVCVWVGARAGACAWAQVLLPGRKAPVGCHGCPVCVVGALGLPRRLRGACVLYVPQRVGARSRARPPAVDDVADTHLTLPTTFHV